MRVLMAASEMTPFAKTGGLGDVVAALTLALGRRGHDVRTFLPLYGRIRRDGLVPVEFLRGMPVEVGGRTYLCDVHAGRQENGGVVYFLAQPELFGREEIYSQRGDEHVRFSVLSHGALVAAQRMGFAPDVVHAHDWHTAILPLLVRTRFSWDRLFQRARTVLTLHNLAYQGGFPTSAAADCGFSDLVPRLHQDEWRRGRFSFLTTGLLYADVLTVVSRTHAAEVQTPEHGFGLDALLRARGVTGIVNGIDADVWDPSRDPHLPARYTASDLSGKAVCRAKLLEEAGLHPGPGGPVFGIVSRLTSQKGFDLMPEVLPEVLRRHDVRLVVLGSGSRTYAEFFEGLARRFRGKASFREGYDEAFAHRIEAGSDAFLMPSLFEPCGLNQMYSLRYGTVPVVRRTGGLADTVRGYDPTTGRGTGVVFDHATPQGLRWAMETTIRLYGDRAAWRSVQQQGMAEDNSWERRVEEYERVYRGV